MVTKAEKKRHPGVRRVLLRGVFWRILFIESVLLAFSLLYRAVTEQAGAEDLFWYGLRIVLLVAVIILFMMVSLKQFLARKIILPLERIDAANRSLAGEKTSGETVNLPRDTPREILNIASSREKMLKQILAVSNERLNLIGFIRKTFGRYLSNKVVDEILETPGGGKIGGTRRTVTVLISDLRGFTSLSEECDPHEMVACLNQYLEKMSEIILKYDGIIDEIMGDAILAVFGAPVRHDNDPERAVACAVEMQNRLHQLNREFTARQIPPMEMGIGINTGEVIVGNIGSELRMKYGIVGTTINEASRIESNTLGGEILIGESTHDGVADIITASDPRTVMMKGIKRPLVFYGVTAIAGNYTVALDVVPSADSLEIRLPFYFWQINGKMVDAESRTGHTVFINETYMDTIIFPELTRFSDVKLKLQFCENAHCFKEFYAKVIDVTPKKNTMITRLGITAMDARDRNQIRKWMDELSKIGGNGQS